MQIRNQQGFTLFEIIIAMGIFLVISLGAAWLLIFGLRSNQIIWDQLEGQASARKAVKHVVDAVRRAEESSVGSYPVVTVEDNQLIFYANMDDDTFRERVRFWLDGTTLKRGLIKPTGTPLVYDVNNEVVEDVAHYVVNVAQAKPVFLYYNEAYTGTQAALTQPVTMTDVHVIRVQLDIEENPDKTPVPLHVEAVAHIRNLKTN